MTDTFSVDIKEFVFQTVFDIYDNIFEINDVKIDVNKKCIEIYRTYLDSYYYNYRVGGNKYNTDIFKKILSYKIIENISSLLLLVDNICMEVLNISRLNEKSILLLSSCEINDRRNILGESIKEEVNIIFEDFNFYLSKYKQNDK